MNEPGTEKTFPDRTTILRTSKMFVTAAALSGNVFSGASVLDFKDITNAASKWPEWNKLPLSGRPDHCVIAIFSSKKVSFSILTRVR